LLAGCATSTPAPVLERPRLPAPPTDFGKAVTLPAARAGGDLKVFALENRKAALLANRRLADDADFYADVRRGFGD
jgi:hypothetical protein